MIPFHRWLAFAFLACTAGGASAEIYRCQARGGVTYQEVPCPAEAIADKMSIPTFYPDYMPERDRLAAREAALDARLLRRLEIESLERIARDERIAREKEAQAALAMSQSQDSPVYVLGHALHAPHHAPRRAMPVGFR
ncbi:MAG: DUF4124 domain-containing protein [Usitatibacter sp.]